jgi:hypothetical protein
MVAAVHEELVARHRDDRDGGDLLEIEGRRAPLASI